MPARSDGDYHLARAAAERDAAARAVGIGARDAHLALAERHEERARQLASDRVPAPGADRVDATEASRKRNPMPPPR